MKVLNQLFAVTAFLIATAFSLHATVNISGTQLANSGQMPGSAVDFSILGNPSQFPSITNYGGGSPPSVETNFTLSPDAGESYGGDGRYSTITDPAASSTITGILFGRAGAVNQSVLTLTLGTGSTTFNYADFNLYVMFGNDIGDGIHDTAISVEDVTKGTAVYELPVVDANTNYSQAAFAEFTITGASAGDQLVIGATAGAGGLNYLGGVSLQSAPEPSTYAMVLAGFGLLALGTMRRRVGSLVR